jgi:hypothetical protein
VSIARSEKTVNVKVAPKTAIASWSPRSSSRARTIRGENCPIASCTATSVTVSTIDVSVTTAVRDRRQDRLRVGRVAHDALRQQLVLVPAVDRNCHEREQDPAEEAE